MLESLSDALTRLYQETHISILLIVGAVVLEKIRPAQRSQSIRGMAFNIVHFLIAFSISLFLLAGLFGLQGTIVAYLGGGLIPLRADNSFWQQLGLGLLLIAVFDFFYYWLHRFQHESKILWSQHKLHHAETELNASSTVRHHWLEDVFRMFVILIPMGILFDAKPPQLFGIWTVLMTWGFVIHLNTRFSFGPLTPVLAGPQLHRIHHSPLKQHHDKNYAAFFPIYDILFGTYYAPKKDEYPEPGLSTGERIDTLGKALFSPFVEWGRKIKTRFGRKAPSKVNIPPPSRKAD